MLFNFSPGAVQYSDQSEYFYLQTMYLTINDLQKQVNQDFDC